MTARRVGLLVLVSIVGQPLGCTPHRPAATSDERTKADETDAPPTAVDPPAPQDPAKMAQDLPRTPSDPSADDPEDKPAPSRPLGKAESVHPRVRVWFETAEADRGCTGFVEVEDIPAYDPRADQVVVLETYARKMSTEREATLRWYDASTGEVAREEFLVGDEGDLPCTSATRRARRRARATNRALDDASWESMTTVPIRRVHEDEYANFREPLPVDASEEDREAHHAWAQRMMPSGQVHVVRQRDGAVVRRPGIRVHERGAELFPNALSALVAHRPSGVVAAIHSDCREDGDCTCNLEDTATVMRWSTTTLAAIDANPCVQIETDDDDFGCTLGSLFES